MKGKKEKAGRMLVMKTPWFTRGIRKVKGSALPTARKSFSVMVNIGSIVKRICRRMLSL